MTLNEKVQSLKAKRANILGRAKAETKKLEAEFKASAPVSKRSLSEQIKSWSGKYYAVVGPLLKQAKEIQTAIDLLR